ncbi:MAG TPA: hypothetical protein VIG04_07980, partial [Gemmatimonadales bacterium]
MRPVSLEWETGVLWCATDAGDWGPDNRDGEADGSDRKTGTDDVSAGAVNVRPAARDVARAKGTR